MSADAGATTLTDKGRGSRNAPRIGSVAGATTGTRRLRNPLDEGRGRGALWAGQPDVAGSFQFQQQCARRHILGPAPAQRAPGCASPSGGKALR